MGIWGLEVRILSRICFVYVVGILEYIFVMSRDASIEVGVTGFFFYHSWISSVAFFTLNEYGNGEMCCVFSVKNFDILYAGALRPFTIGRVGWSGLCSFVRPFMVGAEGFKLMRFHLEFCAISAVLWFMVLLTWF